MTFPVGEVVRDLHLADETITIGDDFSQGIHRCVLERCHIVIDVPRGGPCILESELRDCLIEAKQPLRNSRFWSSSYVRCRFKGVFDGMDFGRSPVPHPMTGKFDDLGDLTDCDFTEAVLDSCRFFSVNVGQQKFAPWPQFVIPYARRKLAAEDPALRWPGEFSDYMALTKRQNAALSASTGIAGDFILRFKVTEDELKKALDDIGGVLL